LCCVQRIKCSLPNCVVRSESGLHCRIVLSVANRVFTAELCCPERIWCSLSNLGCPQRIRCSLPNCCGPQRMRGSLPNSCCPQRIKGLLSNCVVRSDSGVCCRIYMVGRESAVRC
jgi:hypothetical protein